MSVAMDTRVILKKLADEFGLERSSTKDRLKLQKTIYLLQTCGIHLGYGFSWYKYGPYSQELVYDAYRALHADKEKYGHEADGIGFSENTTQHFKKFREALGDSLGEAKELELLASLRFVREVWYPDATRKEVAELFKRHKKNFYDQSPIPDEAIEKAYDKLNLLKKSAVT